MRFRSTNRRDRHLLYEAGGYYLDVQVEQQSESGRVSLVGQIAARNNPDANTGNLPVWLLNRTTLVASTTSNRFGEFQLEGVPSRNLLLRVPLSGCRQTSGSLAKSSWRRDFRAPSVHAHPLGTTRTR